MKQGQVCSKPPKFNTEKDGKMIDENARRAIVSLTNELMQRGVISRNTMTALLTEMCDDVDPVETGPEIPAGWRALKGGERKERGDYILDGQTKKWRMINDNNVGDQIHYLAWKTIRQTINIDLSRQPVELVSFAMDSDGQWVGHNEEVRQATKNWIHSCGHFSVSREFLKSEEPTNFTGNWQDSLLVRPETMKTLTNESENT